MAVEPSGLCPRCLALRSDTGDVAEPTQRVFIRYPATWSLICLTIATSIAGYQFRQFGMPFGAAIAWRMIGGSQWWRLVTSFFVHKGVEHAFNNLFILWIVGKRLERLEGARVFLGLYLACRLTSSVGSLAINPERTCFGASGAVFGVAAVVITIYCIRFRTLTNSQKWRLGFLVFFILGSIVAGFFDKETDNPGHIFGFVAGLVLGMLFASRFGQTSVHQVRIFAGVALILLTSCIGIRLTDRYLVHVTIAERAMNRKEYDDAARELHLAMAMKPGSRLLHDFAVQLQAERTDRVNQCTALEPSTTDMMHSADPCRGKQCDGQLHTFRAADGTTAYYVGTITVTTPLESTGLIEKETTAKVTMQALDEFGEIGCTVSWSGVTRHKVDGNGNPIAKPTAYKESSATISEFDPEAKSLHELIVSAK